MIYITGDTHIPIDIHKLNTENFPEQKNLTKDDYLIICGDFGLIWDYKDWSKEELYWKKWLEEKPFTTLFVDGNHENFDRLNSFPVEEWHGGKVHKISDSIIHLMRGQVFTIDNKKIFTFGGASSTDRGYATGSQDYDRGVSWWDEELPTLDELKEGKVNLAANDWKVDYVITHNVPTDILYRLQYSWGFANPDLLTNYLWEIKEKLNFEHWYAGHHHIDKDVSFDTTILYQEVRKIDE